MGSIIEITSGFLEQLSLIEKKVGEDYLINKGLFLMMYSYFEESVREMMFMILLVFPEKLPKETCTIRRDQLGIVAKDGHKTIIETELYSVFMQGVRIQLENLLKILLNKEYKINSNKKNAISDKTKEALRKLEEISLYRNALIHKGGKVSVEIYEKAKMFKFWTNGNEINFSPETINIFATEFKNFFLYLDDEIKKTYRFYASVGNIEKLRELWDDFFSLKDSANKFENYWEIDIDNDLIIGIKYRLRLCAVRDCGLLSCPPTRNFKRGRMLELPLKPLLHIAFISVSLFIFLVIFLSFLLHLSCLPCVGVGKLFCRFWSKRWLVRPANVLDYEAWANCQI